MLDAARVIAIDPITERLKMVQSFGGAETIDNHDPDEVYDRLMDMTAGRGPDSCIDAVEEGCTWSWHCKRTDRQGEGSGALQGGRIRMSCNRSPSAAGMAVRRLSRVYMSGS